MGPSGAAAFRVRLATYHGVFRHHLLGALLMAVQLSLGGDDNFPNQNCATKDEQGFRRHGDQVYGGFHPNGLLPTGVMHVGLSHERSCNYGRSTQG